MHFDWSSHLTLFTLGFSSLFPLVNPKGTALILNPHFAPCSPADKKSFAITVTLYSMILGLASLFLGSWTLKLMGVSVSTTQLAGGIIIALMGLKMLNAETMAEDESVDPDKIRTSLFYPLTFPLTLGPGCISVLIALSAHAHAGDLQTTLTQVVALALSLSAVMISFYLCLRFSDLVIRRIGRQGSLVLNRLMAFLVFCVGLQVAIAGLSKTFPELFK